MKAFVVLTEMERQVWVRRAQGFAQEAKKQVMGGLQEQGLVEVMPLGRIGLVKQQGWVEVKR